MERQTEKEVSPSQSPNFVSNTYYPLERPKKTSGLKKNFMGSLVLASLVAGFFAYKHSMQTLPDVQEMMQQESAKELVKLVLSMTEENNDLGRQRKIALAIKIHLERKHQSKPSSEPIHEKKVTASPISRSQQGFFKGILTRCYISGHDVHWINEGGQILDHVNITSQLGANESKAREIINSEQEKMVVVVYEKGFEVYKANGELIKTSQP